MKKLLILAIFMSKIAIGQDCNSDKSAWSLSTNFKSITAEIDHVAQKTHIGFSLGTTLFLIKVQEQKGNSYSVLSGAMSLYGTYKLFYKENSYSIHLLTGTVFDLEKGLYLSEGLEFRKPVSISAKGYYHDKMLFFRILYPYDFRVGAIFHF